LSEKSLAEMLMERQIQIFYPYFEIKTNELTITSSMKKFM